MYSILIFSDFSSWMNVKRNTHRTVGVDLSLSVILWDAYYPTVAGLWWQFLFAKRSDSGEEKRLGSAVKSMGFLFPKSPPKKTISITIE